MKNLKLVTAILVAALGLSLGACKQDPLEGQPDSVKNAKKPGGKPTTGTPSDSLLIDVNDFYQIKEGDNLEFKIAGRVIIGGLGHDITIENMKDFPGMSHSKATGEVKWKPSLDYVKSGSEVVVPLKILMVTTGGKTLIRRKEVAIMVLRQFVGPDVVSANSLQEMIEGDIDDFSVTVKSPEEATAPTLSVALVRAGTEDGNAYIELDRGVAINPVRSTVDPSLWTFYLKINLVDAEVTDGADDLYFGLQAVSSYGLTSTVKSFSYRVKTNYEMPRTSWLAETTMTAGKETNFQFMVYDLKDEGRVTASITNCADMPGAQCNCVAMGRSQVQCSVRWTPDASLIGRSVRVNVDSKNTSPIPGDLRNQAKAFNGYVKVVAP